MVFVPYVYKRVVNTTRCGNEVVGRQKEFPLYCPLGDQQPTDVHSPTTGPHTYLQPNLIPVKRSNGEFQD